MKPNPALHQELQDLIAQDQTEAALLLLFEAGIDEAIPLKVQFDVANTEWEARRISFEHWSIVLNRIHYSILRSFSDAVPTGSAQKQGQENRPQIDHTRQAPGPIPHAQVQALLSQNKTPEALEMCRSLGDGYYCLMARYHNLMKQVARGLISDAEAAGQQALISEDISAMIIDLPDAPAPEMVKMPSHAPIPEKKTSKSLWAKIQNLFHGMG